MTSTPLPAAFLPLEDSGYTGKQQDVNYRQQGIPQAGVPLAQGETARGNIIVPDLEHPQPVITFSTSRHTDVTITLDELEALQRMTYQTKNTANELVILARLSWAHPLHTGIGRELLKDAQAISTLPQDYPTCLILKDDDETREGTPILRWTRRYSIHDTGHQDAQDGWTLGFVEGNSLTISTATVGFARWDRPDAIANLIQQMPDRDSLMIISAMMNAEATSALSAKETARMILGDRNRTKVETEPVKMFLRRNNLVSDADEPKYDRGRLRILAIRLNGAKKLPVAIGILAPKAPGTPAEKQALNAQYRDYTRASNEARLALFAVWRTAWEARFTAAMTDFPGWRLVDLPQPPRSNYYQTNSEQWNHILWVTPLDEETWGSVAAAAAREAVNTQMTANSTF